MSVTTSRRAGTRWVLLAGVFAAALIAVGVAVAVPYTATPPVLATPGASPFANCTADNPALQQQFSTLYPNAETEPRISVNPTNPQNIVAEYQQDRWNNAGSRGLVASVTTNQGASWQRVVVPGTSKCSGGDFDRATDPWVSFAPNGDLYAISLSFDVFDSNNAVLVSKSTNGGQTWGSPIAVAADDTNGLDKESITADPHDSNFVYAVWDRFVSPPGFPPSEQGRLHARSFVQQAFFSRTTDGGQTWSAPSVAYNPGTQAGTIGSIINVLPDGTLVDGLIQFADHKRPLRGVQVAVIRSTDRGLSWSKKATIVSPIDPTFPGPTDPDTGDAIRSGGLPDFAVDPASGKLYAVWEDDPTTPGIDEIRFSQSADGGLTWSTPIKINQTPTSAPIGDQQAFTPTVKVAANGTVGVTYYDFRNNTGAPGLTTDFWFIHCHASCTSAGNWTQETHVAGPFDEEQAAEARGFFLGDYMGMDTIGNSFEAFFGQGVSRAASNPSDMFSSFIHP
ncbi:MAG TPA: sialidase family protein [Gaiellaceae bacterium]|nr:sialidase family protein [Gaiellaceae bacterium]